MITKKEFVLNSDAQRSSSSRRFSRQKKEEKNALLSAVVDDYPLSLSGLVNSFTDPTYKQNLFQHPIIGEESDDILFMFHSAALLFSRFAAHVLKRTLRGSSSKMPSRKMKPIEYNNRLLDVAAAKYLGKDPKYSVSTLKNILQLAPEHERFEALKNSAGDSDNPLLIEIYLKNGGDVVGFIKLLSDQKRCELIKQALYFRTRGSSFSAEIEAARDSKSAETLLDWYDALRC